MRSFAVALVASLFLFVGNANASYTIDLLWADNGTPTLTVTPGDGTAANVGSCTTGFFSTETGGRCLEVRLTASSSFKAAIITLGWDNSTSGLVVGQVGSKSFGAFGSGPPGLGPVLPKVAGTADCAPACDTAYGSFGGATAGTTGAGVYTVGSINFDTSGVLAGLHNILNFLRTGVDGAVNKGGSPAPIQINGAILNVIPEPGTASLLGLGIMGLVAAGRSRKA